MAAVALLAFIGASVWVVLERCTASAADTTQQMRAFEIARENMEKVLGADSVQESTEYGISEKFPDIRWQTTIESFPMPVGSNMWVRAVCTAEYTATDGTPKNVELTNWLTNLSNEQTSQLMARSALQKQLLEKHIIATEELAAEYASVNVETLRQWVKNGMPMTGDGGYLKPWLDKYLQTNGNPTEQDKQDTLAKYPELSITKPMKATQYQSTTTGSQTSDSQAQPGPDNTGSQTTSDELDPELQKQIDELMKQQP
jgi:hypothetical protein